MTYAVCHCEDPPAGGDAAIFIIEIASPHFISARNDKVNVNERA